ncbi:MAG TPA: hypothetical protein VGQ34_01595, partial [Sphingomicrobium sp.]|nr:hypothetical protein [Sphingomicrobium sp.]
MREPGTTDQHRSQFADFRMNSELPCHGHSARKDRRLLKKMAVNTFEACVLIYVKWRRQRCNSRRPCAAFDRSAQEKIHPPLKRRSSQAKVWRFAFDSDQC